MPKKMRSTGFKASLVQATFETFSSQETYKLIFIPSGSFCLLTDPKQAIQALNFVSNKLAPKGNLFLKSRQQQLLANLKILEG